MKQQNKETFEKYRENLYTATYSDYSRNLPQYALVALEGAYNDEINSTVAVIKNYNCGNCVLNGLKKIGKWYFEQLENEKKTEIKNETERGSKASHGKKNKSNTVA